MPWQELIRPAIESTTRAVFGDRWLITPFGGAAIEVDAVLDDHGENTVESDLTMNYVQERQVLEVGLSSGLSAASFRYEPGESGLGTARLLATQTDYVITAVEQKLTTIQLFLGGPDVSV